MISSEIGGRLRVAKTLRVVVYELTNDSNQPSESLPCDLTRNDEVDGIFFPTDAINWKSTLSETNITPLKIGVPKRKLVFSTLRLFWG